MMLQVVEDVPWGRHIKKSLCCLARLQMMLQVVEDVPKNPSRVFRVAGSCYK